MLNDEHDFNVAFERWREEEWERRMGGEDEWERAINEEFRDDELSDEECEELARVMAYEVE